MSLELMSQPTAARRAPTAWISETRAEWGRMTPLGLPVVPLVYMMVAMSLDLAWAGETRRGIRAAPQERGGARAVSLFVLRERADARPP